MKLKEVIRGFCFGKLRYQKTWERLFHLSLAGMNIGAGADYANSGEENIVRILRKRITAQKPVLFDVGANVGEYTLMLHEYFPEAEIHSFEPSQNTYNILKKSTEKCGGGGVILHKFGLGENQKNATLYSNGDGSGLASLYNRNLKQFGLEFNQRETVEIRTLDDFCREANISHIHFLKLDVEGNEYKLLENSAEMLNGKIDYIQIEFGGANIDARTYFRDFWELLDGDYRFFRILRDGMVEIEKYSERLEQFACTNYLFVRKELA